MIPNAKVLPDIKRNLGVVDSNTVFDDIIVTGINGALAILNQLDCAPDNVAIDGETTWDKIIPSKYKSIFPAIKQFIMLRTKLIFDPPTSQTLAQAINFEISQLEWRINNYTDIEKAR